MQTVISVVLAAMLAPPPAAQKSDTAPPAEQQPAEKQPVEKEPAEKSDAAPPTEKKPEKVPPIDMSKTGDYTSDKWEYHLRVVAAGTAREGRFGRLHYGGKELRRGQTGDWYDTPWGPMTWLYLRRSLTGSSGWIPLPADVKPRGKRLTPPGLEGEKPQELTEANQGKTVTLELGKGLAIRLKGNPTTGYSWRLAGISEKVVETVGEPAYEEEPHQPGMVGVGGTFVFWLKPIKPGKATVKLEYARPWEKDKPAEKTFSVVIEVVPKGQRAGGTP